MNYTVTFADQTMLEDFAVSWGNVLKGGEIIEFVGDVGVGKTTFVKALARGLEVKEVVQSPTFTISRLYAASKGRELHHYDFYRLQEAGLLRATLAESLEEPSVIIALEWDDTVQDLLPKDRTIRLDMRYDATNDGAREVHITLPESYDYLVQPSMKAAL